MNSEENDPNEIPKNLKKALDDFTNNLKRALSGDNTNIQPVQQDSQGIQNTLRAAFSMLSPGKIQEMTNEAIEQVVQETLPPELNALGVRVTLFTRYMEAPRIFSDESAAKLLHPTWKIHTFGQRALRAAGDNLHMCVGDRVVVVSPDSYAVRALSYYVVGTQGMPDEDDYRIACVFAGGCSMSPDLFIYNEVDLLRQAINSALFDTQITAPPTSDILQDLFDDPEFLMIQNLLE